MGCGTFGATARGTAQLFVDSELVAENLTRQRAGDSLFESGTVEERGPAELKAGREQRIIVRFGSSTTANYEMPVGAALIDGGEHIVGAFRRIDDAEEIGKAVDSAR